MDQVTQFVSQAADELKDAAEKVHQKITEYMQGPPIQIQVCDPMTKDSGFQKHTIYNLKGEDKNGSFDVYRRFNDFLSLREYLVLKWPGCYIPSIPEKQIAQGNDQVVVQERKRHLDFFVKTVAKIPFIYYSDDFNQLFLRSAGQDIGKVIASYPRPTTAEIVDRYRSTFHFEKKEAEDVLMISNTQGSLRRFISIIKQYMEYGQQLSYTRRVLNEQKANLFGNTLVEYEKKCQLEHLYGNEHSLVFANTSNLELNDTVQQIRDQYRINPMDMIYDLMKIELRDCEGMLFAINQRDNYQNIKLKIDEKIREDQMALISLAQGKQTLTTITTSVLKNKDEAQIKVEKRITDNQKESESITEVVEILTAVQGQLEIPKYKKWRASHYRETMNNILQVEGKILEQENSLWYQVYNLAQQVSQ